MDTSTLSALTATSPLDGRYAAKTAALRAYFSEAALMQYRVRIEIEYLISLSDAGLAEVPPITPKDRDTLRGLYVDFRVEDAQAIKDFEKVTNHDVKAVEYWIKQRVDELGPNLSGRINKEFVHFGLTSQDINNTAIPLLLKEAYLEVVEPTLVQLIAALEMLATRWKDIPMLARTHGQPASPTKLGKEVQVFVERLKGQLGLLMAVPYRIKFGGATGAFNAHHVAFPTVDWHQFADSFAEGLGLERTAPTTQIEPYDHLAAFCDGLRRVHTILLDLSKDVWHYVSLDYFKQRIKAGEVGSSAMPHKVNPIDFENAEGNLGLANALLDHLANKLPISRLQRDLTDSTVLRALGTPLGHGLIAYQSLLKGLGKLELNEAKLNEDLDNHWEVTAEAIQTILRRIGYPEPYEALKALTRKNTKITQATLAAFIEELDVAESVKAELRVITPHNYTGLS